MGKFRQIYTELSACDTIMAGYYSLTFFGVFLFTIGTALRKSSPKQGLLLKERICSQSVT